jgi:hypothetical protein
MFIFSPYLLKKIGLRELRNRNTIMEKRRQRRKAEALRGLREDATSSCGSDSEGSDFDVRCLMCQQRRRRMMKTSGSNVVVPLRRQIIEKLTGLRPRGMRRSRSSSNFLQSQKISIV